ncbi:c-type cytochrome [Chitinophaga sp. Mgbs1]|uniref:C-type cytochrome n=1 Tax=Chitinophaga solisilvae TaxID=1233460 RepID=A0A3S1AW10_9BACT|nr:c-type cytochrome [Chitinophaga solisilvae]
MRHRYWWGQGILLPVLTILFISCNKTEQQETMPPVPENIAFVKPAGFPEPAYRFADNPVTTDGFALGKVLFYDGALSRDGTISCASCHIQANAFTHHGHDVSHGIDDRLGVRNSPSIQNLAWSTTFFWDGGVHDLDLQPIVPIENPVEMDEKLGNVIKRLQANTRYQQLFQKAFGSPDINSARMLKALSQFMLMLVSANSRYDRYLQGRETFTDSEKNGLAVFQQKCASCHQPPLFTDNSFRNNGVAPRMYGADSGRYVITLAGEDMYRFKVPSLRNVALTAPYMHDGRFGSLESVMNHYDNNFFNSPTLDPVFRNGFALTETDKRDLTAFLRTLSDKEFITDRRFEPPPGFIPRD